MCVHICVYVCTQMLWSVHQYQIDVNGMPKTTPVHGNSG